MQFIRGRRLAGSMEFVPGRSVSAARLERWIGKDQLDAISYQMRDWKGPPIAVANVPGKVYACGGGDFRGQLDGGQFASLADAVFDYTKRLNRAVSVVSRRQSLTLNAGFSSLSDIIDAAKWQRQDVIFQKSGVSSVAGGGTVSHWFSGSLPVAGGAAAAAPGGTVWTSGSTGAPRFINPPSGDKSYLAQATGYPGFGCNALLYDRLFSVTKTMASTATEAVTGVPTRYQSTTSTDEDYAGGNFLMIECRTVLPATAHNWTVCLYTDQDGNAGVTLPSVTGLSSCPASTLDQPNYVFSCPLAAGDTGIRNLTQMQCSASVATGAIDFTIGHPIAWMPMENMSINAGGRVHNFDFILSSFNLTRIFDGACLALLDAVKQGSGTNSCYMSATVISG
jgi:hypothetical protein